MIRKKSAVSKKPFPTKKNDNLLVVQSSKQPFSLALQLYQFGTNATARAGIQHAKTVILRQVGVNNFFHFRFCDFWKGPTECEFVKIRYQFNTQQLNELATNPPKRIDIDWRIRVGNSLPLCGDRRYKKWTISTLVAVFWVRSKIESVCLSLCHLWKY